MIPASDRPRAAAHGVGLVKPLDLLSRVVDGDRTVVAARPDRIARHRHHDVVVTESLRLARPPT